MLDERAGIIGLFLAAMLTLLTQERCDLCDHAKAVLQRVRDDPWSAAMVHVVVIDLAST